MLRCFYYICEQAAQRIPSDSSRHKGVAEVSAGAALRKQRESGGSWRLCSRFGSTARTILHSQTWHCRAHADRGQWEAECTRKSSKFCIKRLCFQNIGVSEMLNRSVSDLKHRVVKKGKKGKSRTKYENLTEPNTKRRYRICKCGLHVLERPKSMGSQTWYDFSTHVNKCFASPGSAWLEQVFNFLYQLYMWASSIQARQILSYLRLNVIFPWCRRRRVWRKR